MVDKKLESPRRLGRLTILKITISLAATGALVSRLIWPWLKLDAISLGLLIAAALPWVSGLFESLELPGGWKISFRDLQRAADAIPSVPAASTLTDEPSYLAIQNLDPQLALVGLRIEVEKRLQQLAALHGVEHRRGAAALVRELARRDALPVNVAGALEEVVMAGNAAAHGAEVPPSAQDFAFTEGPSILVWLDSVIESAK